MLETSLAFLFGGKKSRRRPLFITSSAEAKAEAAQNNPKLC